MSLQAELPIIYRSISIEGLSRLRSNYDEKLTTSNAALRDFYEKRIRFIDLELERRNDEL